MDKFDVLIVGAGFAGSVCAERLASAGQRVLLIDQRQHIGGNAYDYYNEAGILVHKYGPHIFHTNSKDVFEYLSRFTAWRPYHHRVLAQTEHGLLPVPINRTTIAAFHGDAQAAIDAIYRSYTFKQWGCELEALDSSVLARVKVRDSDDAHYFTDEYQYMPADGYARLFERLLTHRRISIMLQTYSSDVTWDRWKPIIWTGPIDEYFNYQFGRLPYRSATFTFTTLDCAQAQPVAVVNMPDERRTYTRVTEFKHLTGQVHPKTTIAYEVPSDEGEPFWPVPKPENAALYKRYKALAEATPHVYFCGRLGTYAYLNIDQVVAQALKLTNTLIMKGHHADAVTA